MSDPQEPNPQAPAIDLSQYVPKTDYEKVMGESKENLKTMKEALDDAQKKLLDPKYIEYLSQQEKGKKTPSAIDPAKAAELKDAPKELVEMISQHNERFQTLENAVTTLGAFIELAQVEKQYPDFNDVRDEVRTILDKSNNNLTIEQAYWIAKQHKSSTAPPQGDEPPAKTAQPKGSEKPGSTTPPPDDVKPKTFKSQEEAGIAALESIKEKYGITGDII